MKNKKLVQYISELNKKVSELSEIVDFLTKNNKDDVAFSYDRNEFYILKCFAKFIKDGKMCVAYIPCLDIGNFTVLKNNEFSSVFSGYFIGGIKKYYKLDKVQNVVVEIDKYSVSCN